MLPARLSSGLAAMEPSPRLARAPATHFNQARFASRCADLRQRRLARRWIFRGLKESKRMKPGLRPGASRVNRITIGPERTISFMGDDARTYATPAMIRDIEYTCRDLIMEHADPGEDSVGMEVAVKHLA